MKEETKVPWSSHLIWTHQGWIFSQCVYREASHLDGYLVFLVYESSSKIVCDSSSSILCLERLIVAEVCNINKQAKSAPTQGGYSLKEGAIFVELMLLWKAGKRSVVE